MLNQEADEAKQEDGGREPDISFSTFARSSSRKSLTNNVAMEKWLEAQEKNQERYQVIHLLLLNKQACNKYSAEITYCGVFAMIYFKLCMGTG